MTEVTRIRRRATGTNYNYIGYAWSNQTPPAGAIDSVASTGTNGLVDRQFIRDVTGAIKKIKPVLHEQFSLRSFNTAYWKNSAWYVVSSANNHALRFARDDYDYTGKILAPISDVDAGNFCRSALDEWTMTVPSAISIANFFYELKDLPSLIVKIQGAKTLPNGFLAYEFGWKPLLADLKTLATIIPETIKKLEHLRSINGNWRRVHFRKELPMRSNFTLNGSELLYPYQTGVTLVSVDNYRSWWTASALIRTSIPDIDSDIGFLKAFLLAMGLNNPAKIVWNAIPYSFVVDWFLKLSDRMKPLKVYNQSLDVRNFCYSVKEQGVCRLGTGTTMATTVSGALAFREVGLCTFRRYERKVTLPVGYGTLQLSTLSTEQQALLIALISQRLLK